MKIIIVGNGKVGYSLAETLSQENNDVVIIDKNAELLKKASENLDVLCIEGSGASAKTLMKAGVSEADILIAVTSKDEMNMICGLVARKLGAKHTVARIREPEYADEIDDLKEDFDLDMITNPEQALARDIARYLEFPTAMTVDIFAKGRMEVVEIKVTKEMAIIGRTFKKASKKHPHAALIRAIYRHKNLFIPDDNTIIVENDLIYIIGWRQNMYSFYSQIGIQSKKINNIMIMGGGRIAFYFSKLLEDVKSNIKIIEQNKDHTLFLAENLPHVLVINGDGSDYNLLHAENIDKMDAFVALTGRDEDNLMSALLAKQNGVDKVVAKISRIEYLDIVDKLDIDYVVSPKPITAKYILRYVRGLQKTIQISDKKIYKVIGDESVAFEFAADRTFDHLNVSMAQLNLKENVLIAALIRDKEIIVPKENDMIKLDDYVVIITNNRSVSQLNDIIEQEGTY